MIRSTPRLFTLLLAVLATAAAAGEPAAKIVSGPTVTKAAVGYTVSFRVNRPCDVTVRIANARGDVIRHLASGMVGVEKAAKGTRSVVLEEEDRPQPTPVYDRSLLTNGHSLVGPALIESEQTTLLIPPGWGMRVDRYNNVVIEEGSGG